LETGLCGIEVGSPLTQTKDQMLPLLFPIVGLRVLIWKRCLDDHDRKRNGITTQILKQNSDEAGFTIRINLRMHSLYIRLTLTARFWPFYLATTGKASILSFSRSPLTKTQSDRAPSEKSPLCEKRVCSRLCLSVIQNV